MTHKVNIKKLNELLTTAHSKNPMNDIERSIVDEGLRQFLSGNLHGGPLFEMLLEYGLIEPVK